jgi:hypothetical protein
MVSGFDRFSRTIRVKCALRPEGPPLVTGRGRGPARAEGREVGRVVNRGVGRYVYVGEHVTMESAVPAAHGAPRGWPHWHCLFRYC